MHQSFWKGKRQKVGKAQAIHPSDGVVNKLRMIFQLNRFCFYIAERTKFSKAFSTVSVSQGEEFTISADLCIPFAAKVVDFRSWSLKLANSCTFHLLRKDWENGNKWYDWIICTNRSKTYSSQITFYSKFLPWETVTVIKAVLWAV